MHHEHTQSLLAQKNRQAPRCPRIWLDMPRLVEAGLAPGARFDLDVVPPGIRIRASDSGSRCVSAKTLKSGVQLPVIDLNSKACLSPFDAAMSTPE